MSTRRRNNRTTLPRMTRKVMDIILRVPPLFVMDSIFLSDLKIHHFYDIFQQNLFLFTTTLSKKNHELNNSYNYNQIITDGNTTNTIASVFHTFMDNKSILDRSDLNFIYFQTILHNASAVIMAFVFLVSLSIFLLRTEHLFQFYKWILSIAIAISSYILNDHYINMILAKNQQFNIREFSFDNGVPFLFIANYVIQIILALSFVYLTGIYRSIIPFLAAFFLILPYYGFLTIFVSNKYLIYFPSVTLVAFSIYITVSLLMELQNIIQAFYVEFIWIKSYMRNLGLFSLIETQWNRLHVPHVFRVFWLTRITQQALFLFFERQPSNDSRFLSFIFDGPVVIETAKYLLVRGCETLIAVLGMTSVLCGITQQIGCLMQSFLMLDDPDDRSIGSISAILFFILALQNGLTSMEPEKRLMRLYRNFCLLFTAMLHFIHNMVSPLLLSLSASRNRSLHRHLRALTVCSFLIISPYLFLNYLWNHHALSTWLLAVSVFGIEVIVKVIITFLIYSLFMIDAFRSSMWEQLDDYVYYVRTVGNLIEFVFGVFLFLNGTWILVFESGGTIRALMMCIHAYFNIWCQAIAGLKAFYKRYQAMRKINLLAEASPEQLQQFDDVCSICYQELTSARITKCNHYFHSICLRKWLYFQDMCPLCHNTLSM